MTDSEKPPSPNPSAMNDWFLSLPPERQAILREDKWMLAEAAFAAGRDSAGPFIGYRYVAVRTDDGSPWAGMFFMGAYAFAHEKNMKKAFYAKTPEELQARMFNDMCAYPNNPMSDQANGRYSFWKIANGRVADVVAEDFVPGHAYFMVRSFNSSSVYDADNWFWKFKELARDQQNALNQKNFAYFRRREDFDRVWETVCQLARMLRLVLTEDAAEVDQPVSDEMLINAVNNFAYTLGGGLKEAERIKEEASVALLKFSQFFRRRAKQIGFAMTLSGYDPTLREPFVPKEKEAA
jgi:hypothetical protein